VTATGTSAARRSVRENLAALNDAQKKGAGVPAYMRWVNRRLARGVAAVAAAWGLTPNAVTMISAALSAAGLAVMLIVGPAWWSALLTGALLAAGFVFDSADGQVARLTGTSSAAGEWMDHVVDAIRTPAVHLTVAVAVLLHRPDLLWVGVIALLFVLVAVGQFMSQILAEQLVRTRGSTAEPSGSGIRQSWLLLPTDTGVLCWSFVLWAVPPLFAVLYAALFAIALLHSGVSMRRKYVALTAL